MQPSPELLAFIALIASALANYLKSDGAAPWKNALVAAIALVVFGLITVWLTNGFTSDIRGSILAIIAMIMLLANNELAALLAFIQGLPLPASRPRPTPPPSVRPTVQSWTRNDEGGAHQ